MENENNYYLLFELNQYTFAFDVVKINRIARAVEITPIPNSPDIVTGVINVQGNIMPVIDIRKRFGFPDKKITVNDFLIIGKVKELSIALIIDNVIEIIEFSEDKIIDKKNVLPGIPYVDGIIKLDGDIIYINDLSRLLSLDEEQEIYTLLKQLDTQKNNIKIKDKPGTKKTISPKKASPKKTIKKKTTESSNKKKNKNTIKSNKKK